MKYLNVLLRDGGWSLIINIWPHQNNGGGQVVVQGVSKSEAVRIANHLADACHTVNLID